MKADDPHGIGPELDRFQWDYQPQKADRRFFLKPVGDFFRSFRWDGQDENVPVPGGRTEDAK